MELIEDLANCNVAYFDYRRARAIKEFNRLAAERENGVSSGEWISDSNANTTTSSQTI